MTPSPFKRREITDIKGTSVYLRRWSMALPLGWSLKVHHILRTDYDRCQHDHPWGFWTCILWGGYDELVGESQRMNRMRPGRIAWRPAAFRHRIVWLPRGHAWTLVITRGRAREWGFYTQEGWMHWRKFVDAARSNRVLWCHDGAERAAAEAPTLAPRIGLGRPHWDALAVVRRIAELRRRCRGLHRPIDGEARPATSTPLPPQHEGIRP